MFYPEPELSKPQEANDSKKLFEPLNCNFSDYLFVHSFRLLTQTISLSQLDFVNHSFRVNTTLSVHPLNTRVTHIIINLGKSKYLN